MKPVLPNSLIENFIASLPVQFKGFYYEHIETGVSTNVYKLKRQNLTYYLRILPKDRFVTPQVLAHKLLTSKGVTIPEVIFYEDYNKVIKRSFMIVSEIEGKPLEGENLYPKTRSEVLIKAGEQIALANSIMIEGIGWIQDNTKTDKLYATGTSYYDYWLGENLVVQLKELKKAKMLEPKEVDLLRKIFDIKGELINSTKSGHLAHGDFDPTHIYFNDNQYSGIIDWGDIRSTSIYHDLGHFDIFSGNFINDLLFGYQKVTKLDNNYSERIALEGLLISVKKLWWNNSHNFTGRKSSTRAFDYIKSKLKTVS